MRFTIQPAPGESGFSQWAAAMKMVAQLPGGIPPEFRRRLWLTLAERHLAARGIDWPSVERSCFSEWSHPADAELGVQIVKDLHRTGCSLFCGEDGQENQALLKKVLLAYARWNKAVGYCQGFNMLAALILQVTDKCESEALKLMIYLIEGVLPDSYFADSLRGLSVDMAVFRELLRTKLPRLSRHLDTLQNAAKDGNTSYEPPLTNVFTMQWFLTLFCNCLPQPTVLRVWDLILLEGNEILLRTALAIWQALADRILSVHSADEFYCIMGVLTRELLEFGLIDGNSLIKAVVAIGPLTELKSLREHYLYNINPWGAGIRQNVVDRQMKLYPRERLALDISALKKQYVKLKQRQRQAQIIFSTAISRQPPPSAPVAMNHLLLGKTALIPAKRLGPPKGSIPPARQPTTLQWKDAPRQCSSSSSSDTELCDEPSSSSEDEDAAEPSQFDDNPESASDKLSLMNNDNISAKPSATEQKENLLMFENVPSQIVNDNFLPENQKSELSDIFDTASTSAEASIISDAVKTTENESDEDSFDFEKFLADRVQYLQQSSLPEEQPEADGARLKLGRRNSERALQIIQENSLILHRILQYQSRLSPSPPPISTDSETIISNLQNEPPGTEDGNIKICQSFSQGDNLLDENSEQELELSASNGYKLDDVYSVNEPTKDIILPQEDEVQEKKFMETLFDTQTELTKIESMWDPTTTSPGHDSKYIGILEKSKNLEEQYNRLILSSGLLITSCRSNKSATETSEVIVDHTLSNNLKIVDIPETEQNNISQEGSSNLTEPLNAEERDVSKYNWKYSQFSRTPLKEKTPVNDSPDMEISNVQDYKLQEQKSPPFSTENYQYFSKNKNEPSEIAAVSLDRSESLTSPYDSKLSLSETFPPSNGVQEQKSHVYDFKFSTFSSNLLKKTVSHSVSPDDCVSEKSKILEDKNDFLEHESSVCSKQDYSHLMGDNLDNIGILSSITLSSPIKSPKELTTSSIFETEVYTIVCSDMENKEESYKSIISESDSSRTCYNFLPSPVRTTDITIKEKSPDKIYTDSERFSWKYRDKLSPLKTECIGETDKISLSPILKSPEHFTKLNEFKSLIHHSKKSPSESEPKSPGECSSSRSPNKVFNPFPVSLSSRQIKEVPLKLGLYKK